MTVANVKLAWNAKIQQNYNSVEATKSFNEAKKLVFAKNIEEIMEPITQKKMLIFLNGKH